MLWLVKRPASFVLLFAAMLVHAGISPAVSAADGEKQTQASPANDRSLDQQLAKYQKLAAIFNAIDPVDVKGKRWVSIETSPVGWNWKTEGWLLEDKLEAIKILDANGGEASVRKPRPGEKRLVVKDGKGIPLDEFGKHEAAWKVETGNYITVCQEFLKKGLPKPKPSDQLGAYAMANNRSELAGVAIDAARYGHWAVQIGEKRLALELYALAKSAHQKYTATYTADRATELEPFIANSIAEGYRSGAIWRANTGAPRADLLKTWETLAKLPYHQHVAEARQMVADYKDQIADDDAWKEPDSAALVKLTTDQQVAYWLYHLRDADLRQMSDPGMCCVLDEWGLSSSASGGKKPNPAIKLEKLGFAAIPAIIAHLDDTHPTRCEGHWRSFWPESSYLLRYGDCCQQIFESISGHSIYSREYTNGYPIKDNQGKQCKAAAERWWRDYQRKGEKQMLIEGTESGDPDSPEQARRLVAKYPDSAIEPLSKGLRQCKIFSAREGLVRAAGDIKGDRVLPLLRAETAGPYRDTRTLACWAIAERYKDEGVRAIIKEWANSPTEKEFDDSDERMGIENLISCLARCGDPAAITALARGFGDRPREIRARIIESLRDVKNDLQDKPLAPAIQTTIDNLLAAALDDPDDEDSPVGDLAAESLVQRWGKPNLFDIDGQFSERAHQRLLVENVWLDKSGKKPLPLPPPRKINPAPDAVVRPLLDRLQTAVTVAARRTALDQLEKLGAAALPACRRSLHTMKPDAAARPELQSLVQRTALTIQEVRFAENSVPPSNEVRRAFETIRGKPITVARYKDMLHHLIHSMPRECRGIKLIVERLGNDTGALLIVSFVPKKNVRQDASPQLHVSTKIILDKATIFNGQQGVARIGEQGGFPEIEEWPEASRAMKTAFEATPEQYVFVRVDYAESR